jgi:hypothetical protein
MGLVKVQSRRAISEVIGAIFVFIAITAAAGVLSYYLTTTIGTASGVIGTGLNSDSRQLDEQLSLSVVGLSSSHNNVTVLIYNSGGTTVNLNKAIMYIGSGSGNVEIQPTVQPKSGYTVMLTKCSQGSTPGALLPTGSCFISIIWSSGTFSSSEELLILTQETNAYYVPL